MAKTIDFVELFGKIWYNIIKQEILLLVLNVFFGVRFMPVQDINSMTTQQILEYVRDNSYTKADANRAISLSIENFFKKHDITVRCPACNSPHKVKNGANASGILRYKCKDCGKAYMLTTNTIFEGLDYTVDEMVAAVHSVLSQEAINYSARNIKNDDLSLGTMWLLQHKILYILAHMPHPKLSGVIQIDEKYVRETQKGSRKLISFVNPSEGRNKRKHHAASKCGIFGPEFINVLCATDSNGHYWAKCICLGPMELEDLDNIKDFISVAYICSDNLDVYSDWCEKRGYKHYVEPSTYRKERKARGYIDTDNLYATLTEEEYKIDEQINRQMYKEGKYPHIENGEHKLSFDEFQVIKNKFGLNLAGVNGFHSVMENFLMNAKGVSSEYLEDYVGTLVFIMNYKKEHHISSFSYRDAEQILVQMIKHTIKTKDIPTRQDLQNRNVEHLRRPSTRSITNAKKMMKKSRQVIIEPVKYDGDLAAYEGDDEISQYIFNKKKFFTSLGTVRINELCKLYRIYDRNETKKQRIEKLCNLENAEDIIFNEIAVMKYGSVEQMRQAFTKTPEKRKRGRPKKEQPI